MKESLTVRRAKEWRFAERKFYNSEDFFHYATKGLRLSKPIKYLQWKRIQICEGDIIKDLWGKIGVVIEVFLKSSAEHEWCDYIAICKQDFTPYLEVKLYWKSMLKTVYRIAKNG